MAVTIDENILIFTFGAILLPFIVFMIKLLIDFRVMKAQLDDANQKLREMSQDMDSINRIWNKISIMEVHIENLMHDRNSDIRDNRSNKGAPVTQDR